MAIAAASPWAQPTGLRSAASARDTHAQARRRPGHLAHLGCAQSESRADLPIVRTAWPMRSRRSIGHRCACHEGTSARPRRMASRWRTAGLGQRIRGRRRDRRVHREAAARDSRCVRDRASFTDQRASLGRRCRHRGLQQDPAEHGLRRCSRARLASERTAASARDRPPGAGARAERHRSTGHPGWSRRNGGARHGGRALAISAPPCGPAARERGRALASATSVRRRSAPTRRPPGDGGPRWREDMTPSSACACAARTPNASIARTKAGAAKAASNDGRASVREGRLTAGASQNARAVAPSPCSGCSGDDARYRPRPARDAMSVFTRSDPAGALRIGSARTCASSAR